MRTSPAPPCRPSTGGLKIATAYRSGSYVGLFTLDCESRRLEQAGALDAEYLGLAQSFHLSAGDRPLEPGDDVFSLIRDSALSGDEYISRFFDTGGEHQKALV